LPKRRILTACSSEKTALPTRGDDNTIFAAKIVDKSRKSSYNNIQRLKRLLITNQSQRDWLTGLKEIVKRSGAETITAAGGVRKGYLLDRVIGQTGGQSFDSGQ
jgi:hypothetical protein